MPDQIQSITLTYTSDADLVMKIAATLRDGALMARLANEQKAASAIERVALALENCTLNRIKSH